MKILRACSRVLAIAVWTGALFVVLTLTSLLVASRDRRRRIRHLLVRAWAKGVAAIARIRIRVDGEPPLAPFFLVSNHLSYVDIVVLSSLVDCVYVARGDLAGWPVIGRLCRSVDILFVDRTRRADVLRVNRAIEGALETGESVALFAEGTSTSGEAVGPFKPSLLEYPARRLFPVDYATISYRTVAGDTPAAWSVCWWGDMTFPKHFFELMQLSAVESTIHFGSEALIDSDRKALARRLHAAVSQTFVPVEAIA